MHPSLRYLGGYPDHLVEQVQQLVDSGRLAEWLKKRYPTNHTIKTDKALYDYVQAIKQQYLKKSAPLSKVVYDGKIHLVHNALGLHSYVSRVHGGKLKAKNEIRIASMFKEAPEPFLRMLVVHELAHIKEKDHNKAFYQLCCHMAPDYHQLEFDARLFLIDAEIKATEMRPT